MIARVLGFAFSALLTGLAIYVVWLWLDAPALSVGFGWTMLAAAVLGVLGVNGMLSAIRGRPSLISRIGPLP